MKRILPTGFLFLLAVHGSLTQHPTALTEGVRKQYAPDKRTAIFDVKLAETGVLTGKTNLPDARAALLEELKGTGIAFADSLKTLFHR